MNVEIITTGTELLLGEILNTNFPYLTRELNRRGFNVLYQTTVGDNHGRMLQVLAAAAARADIIITSGGLGPTRGDITKETAAELCGAGCYFDAGLWEKICGYLTARGQKLTENNKKQAYVPEGAEILDNEAGTAPGLWLEREIKGAKKLFVLLPGPPHELQDICEKQLWPRLAHRYGGEGLILSRTLHLRKIGESAAADLIDDLVLAQSNPTIALYARRGEVVIRMTAKAGSEEEAQKLLQGCEQALRARLYRYVYGVDDASLAQTLGELLRQRQESIALAESCTGGLASSLLTDVPGSSEYLRGSVVSYTNEVKMRLAGVQAATLAAYSAVSGQCAREMALGAKALFGSDYGVGITGNAGPAASEGQPVGLVYIAVAHPGGVLCREHRFRSTRTENKLRIAQTALSQVIDIINSSSLQTEEDK